MNWLQACLAGDCQPEDIDDYVDAWHDGDGDPRLGLHEYLGLTWGEYSRWAEFKATPEQIVQEHRAEAK